MSEEELVARTPSPATVSTLLEDLRALGIREGETLMVHSSLSAIGWVAGREHAVVLALQQVLGDEGTLVMPSHSSSLSDPAAWTNPPVPQTWFKAIQHETPAYDPDMTPTRVWAQSLTASDHNEMHYGVIIRAIRLSLAVPLPLASSRITPLHPASVKNRPLQGSTISMHRSSCSAWATSPTPRSTLRSIARTGPPRGSLRGEHRSSSMGKGAGNATRTWIWNPRTL